jgi:hypothetical protein
MCPTKQSAYKARAANTDGKFPLKYLLEMLNATCVAELAAELLDVHAMLRHFTRANENHGHVQPVAFS